MAALVGEIQVVDLPLLSLVTFATEFEGWVGVADKFETEIGVSVWPETEGGGVREVHPFFVRDDHLLRRGLVCLPDVGPAVVRETAVFHDFAAGTVTQGDGPVEVRDNLARILNVRRALPAKIYAPVRKEVGFVRNLYVIK